MSTPKTLSPAAQAISADLQAVLTLDENGKGEADNTVYFNHAEKAGYTKETMEGVKNYDRTFAAGAMDATQAIGLKAVTGGAKFEAAEVTIQGAKGEEFGVKYTPHSKGVMKGADGQPDKPWEKFGSVRVAHKSSVGGKGGDMGIAMSMANAAAEAVLKKA